LDRPISFEERELDFGNYQPPRLAPTTAPAPESSNKSSVPLPGRKIPK
jgi:hypothetical protein